MKFHRIACTAFVLAVTGFLTGTVWAQSNNAQSPEAIFKSLKLHRGHVDLHGNTASLDLPAGFAYLDPADTETFLTKIYNNPPSANGPDSEGMIIPDGVDPLSAEGWAAVLTYDDSGHVSDSDAASTDFDELLKTMQKRTSDANPDRVKAGYPAIELKGWAEPPHYDPDAKTLYWAERFRFGDDTQDTLNYKIRVLGRQGVLDINVIDSIENIDKARKLTPTILKMASFNQGSAYGDFSSATDRVAGYGLAGLIAGGVLLKAGFFKALLIGMAALWKPIAAGVVILGGGIARFFRRGPRVKPDA